MHPLIDETFFLVCGLILRCNEFPLKSMEIWNKPKYNLVANFLWEHFAGVAVWISRSVWEEESTGALERISQKHSIHRSMSPASPTQRQLQLAHLQPEADSGARKAAFCVNSSFG